MAQIAIRLSYKFLLLSPWRISHIIQFHLDHLDPTLVDHLGYHLAAYSIRHLFRPSVSWGSQATLFRGLLYINAVKVLVVEHLMGRQQLFLELLYCYASMCLPIVLILFFGRFWKIAFASKSLFFYLGLGQPRTKSSSARFFGLPGSPLSFFCM